MGRFGNFKVGVIVIIIVIIIITIIIIIIIINSMTLLRLCFYGTDDSRAQTPSEFLKRPSRARFFHDERRRDAAPAAARS